MVKKWKTQTQKHRVKPQIQWTTNKKPEKKYKG
jgi:hypothetical protein